MIKTLDIVVCGRVQKVGYRGWALSTANRLGVFGWVKNLPNGNVEMIIRGEEAQLDKMVVDCNKGPALARVDNMVVSEIKSDAYATLDGGFKIL